MAEIGSSQNLKSNLTHGKWGISSSARVLKTFANDIQQHPYRGTAGLSYQLFPSPLSIHFTLGESARYPHWLYP